MRNRTEVTALIDIYKFRIERDKKLLDVYDKAQREYQRMYQDCGTMCHQIQIEESIRDYGKLILSLKKSLKLWQKNLENEQNYLIYLDKQNS